ncbi:fibropellin-1-like [Branchiostoma floridae]|uniref:Fibropellin-1-like n=1 Tax=Branchiostoma floridae TaxID=7739 RepID=A0A9J7MVM9_BRAFL|nr:fibropellin-1-like [Branchiostoma floridae]
MCPFLLFIAAVTVCPASTQGQQYRYLTTQDNWAFYQVLSIGQMTNINVRATCLAAGMRYTCHSVGTVGCEYYWEPSCIAYDTAGIHCDTHWVLANNLCGPGTDPRHCQPLDDTFVYIPGWQVDGSACGVDYETATMCVEGANYYNMYALCILPTCARYNPCVHGTCMEAFGGYTCTCENGWEGTNCDRNVNECAPSPCLHGTCTDGVASYTCSCENGWMGHRCDQSIDDCAPSPCVHGVCTDQVASYSCYCENGWTGHNCDQDIDECASSPCVHGTCTDGVASYTCSCENGWTGHNCDQDIDECASSPCWLGGTCLDHVNGYSCVCPKGTTGNICDTVSFAGDCYQFSTSALTHQDATQACRVIGGRMVDVRDQQQHQFLADTIAATTGESHWLAMKTAPLSIVYSDGTPVSGGAVAWSAGEPWYPVIDLCVLLDSSDSYKAKTALCTEQHNYVCQSDNVPCVPNVCQNGGNCSSCFGGTDTFCDCLDGFEGSLCEIKIDLCALVACPFDWTCVSLLDHLNCLAPTVRISESYRCSSASCPGDMYCKEEGGASFSCWLN